MRDSRYEIQDSRSGNGYRDLSAQLDLLGRKLNMFIDSVERLHRTNRRDISKSESRIAHIAS
jgi:DNA topoisomerase IB